MAKKKSGKPGKQTEITKAAKERFTLDIRNLLPDGIRANSPVLGVGG